MNYFPGHQEFMKNVQAITRSLNPRSYAGAFLMVPTIDYLPEQYTPYNSLNQHCAIPVCLNW